MQLGGETPAGRWRPGERRDRLGDARVEIVLSLAGIAITVVAIVGAVVAGLGAAESTPDLMGAVLFLLMVSGLMLGGLAFLVSRLGFNIRRLEPVHRDGFAPIEKENRQLLVLVPSYCEEPSVVRQTLISAALQTYGPTNVTLLIDNPPEPSDLVSRELLHATQSLPAGMDSWLEEPQERTRSALDRHLSNAQSGEFDMDAAVDDLVGQLRWSAAWLRDASDREPTQTHTDHLFVTRVLREPADEMEQRATHLRDQHLFNTQLAPGDLRGEYERLAHRFDASFSAFERKRYENLSWEPNKAMNLNSYLKLLGGRWRTEARHDGVHLVPAGEDEPSTIDVTRPDYVVTLDADSIIVPDYAATLAAIAEGPDGADLAVVQTPYSAIPPIDAPLERIAGATTDIQYLIHQGFQYFGGAFWVGANAVIRPRALVDLRTVTIERGHEIERFISDRTVIEDTESSLDLVARGWRIHNHADRLSFSATPPDFGSLVIQRRRWANGGLILTPKLWSAWRRNPLNMFGLFLRSHYLVSIAATNLALLVMLVSGFGSSYASWWLPASAAPYVVLYTRDLRQAGYHRRDVIAVYSLNLLLMPANVAGVVKSLDQVVRRTKTPFARTPKVEGRTPAAPLYHLASLALLVGALITSGRDFAAGRHAHAAFAGGNALLLAFAITAFVGWSALAEDVRVGVADRIRRRR